jgi:hypothetical protein
MFLPMPVDRKFNKAYMMVKSDKIICDSCNTEAEKPVMNSETKLGNICFILVLCDRCLKLKIPQSIK